MHKTSRIFTEKSTDMPVVERYKPKKRSHKTVRPFGVYSDKNVMIDEGGGKYRFYHTVNDPEVQLTELEVKLLKEKHRTETIDVNRSKKIKIMLMRGMKPKDIYTNPKYRGVYGWSKRTVASCCAALSEAKAIEDKN